MKEIFQPHYNILGFNIAVQYGPTVSQSVMQVHVNILSRNYGDLDHKYDIYDRL